MTGKYPAQRHNKSLFALSLAITFLVVFSTVATKATGLDDSPPELTDGVWLGEGGPQTFLFQFDKEGDIRPPAGGTLQRAKKRYDYQLGEASDRLAGA